MTAEAGKAAPGPQDKNLEAIGEMERKALESRSFGEKLSDRISAVASTPAFAFAHVVFFTTWLVTQSGVVPAVPVFDPFPFTFLTLVVSLEAIFLTIFVLISQSHLTQQADFRSHLDLQVNLLGEQEETKALKLLYSIAEHLKVPNLPPDDELAAETHISDLIEGIDKSDHIDP